MLRPLPSKLLLGFSIWRPWRLAVELKIAELRNWLFTIDCALWPCCKKHTDFRWFCSKNFWLWHGKGYKWQKLLPQKSWSKILLYISAYKCPSLILGTHSSEMDSTRSFGWTSIHIQERYVSEIMLRICRSVTIFIFQTSSVGHLEL